MTNRPVIFDRALFKRRLARAARLGPETFLAALVAADLVDRLSAVNRSFDLAVDLGSPVSLRGALGPEVRRVIRVASTCERAADANLCADEEALPFRDGSLDLVVSSLALQFVNDLPGTLLQIRRALKPDGLFLAALVGGNTLGELRQVLATAEAEMEGGASPRVAPFVDVRDMGALLQRAGFALPVADVDRHTVRYGNVLALMQDLRRMGATNVLVERRRVPLRRSTLIRAAEAYAECFADPDGRLRATFEIIFLSGWAPHESQQQPLRPGSARARLADALGTREISAGDKVPVGRDTAPS